MRRASLKASIANLDMQYGPRMGVTTKPPTEPVVMMRPLDSRIIGRNAWVTASCPTQVLWCHELEGAVDGDACIVEQAAEWSPLLFLSDARGRRVDRRLVSHIDGERDDVFAILRF
jgi:hypothetical protein